MNGTERPTRSAALGGLLAGLLLTAGLAGAADLSQLGGPRIVNGLNSHDFPTTGALLYPSSGGAINENNAGSWCTGTLIGCSTFLTAAHCVEDDGNPNRYWVFLQHAGIRAVTSITPHPSYTSAGFPEYDVAVLKLGAPVHGIDPTELNTQVNPPVGTEGTIAGYGQTSGNAGDYGIKRYGRVVTTSCAGQGVPNNALVCWRFANPVGTPGDDSNTCNGDSGGPLFINLGGGQTVAGITSGGNNGTCLATDTSYDANVFTYRSFIQSVLGSDSTSTCGGLPAVGGGDVDVTGFDGRLSGGNNSATHTFSVSGSPAELRVTLKGEDNDNPLDADMFVKHGLGASASTFDCKSDGNASVGECTFASPNSGTWSVFVRRQSGSGEYQITSTTFGGDPAVCGNDVNEGGEECDGSDDAACPGACGFDCSCPAPVCGNGIVESGEQCDGSSASNCPTGACASDCQCQAPVCGNGITEAGEACDGSDDQLCPGLCQGNCFCPPASCSEDLYVTRARADARRFVWKSEIDNFFGEYDDFDPRDGFTFVVSQGPDSVTVTIPAGHAGWAKSKPDRGRFVWKGSRSGITRVKLIHKRAQGFWKLIVKGRDVPGAGALDVITYFADVQATIGGTCVAGLY